MTGWFGCADGRVGEESLSGIVRGVESLGGWAAGRWLGWVGIRRWGRWVGEKASLLMDCTEM